MRHFTHIWQNPPDFFPRYQVITFQHCIKAQDVAKKFLDIFQHLSLMIKILFQNRHKPGEAAETAAVQQRRRDRLQLWLC